MLGGTLVLGGTLGARAQPATNVRRIGILDDVGGTSPAEFQQFWAIVGALGWIEGQNLVVEYRNAGGKPELLRPYAEELVRLNVEIIGTMDNAAAIAAKNATTRIPIVMMVASDPVRAGLVASLAKPGGNITGFSFPSSEVLAKRLELLRELLPTAQRVGVLVDSTNPPSEIMRQERERLYRSFGMQPIIVEVAACQRARERGRRSGSTAGAGADCRRRTHILFEPGRARARGASACAPDDCFLESLCGGWRLAVAQSRQRGE
jgi:putative ABC transport system substrate-binding protein